MKLSPIYFGNVFVIFPLSQDVKKLSGRIAYRGSFSRTLEAGD